MPTVGDTVLTAFILGPLFYCNRSVDTNLKTDRATYATLEAALPKVLGTSGGVPTAELLVRQVYVIQKWIAPRFYNISAQCSGI